MGVYNAQSAMYPWRNITRQFCAGSEIPGINACLTPLYVITDGTDTLMGRCQEMNGPPFYTQCQLTNITSTFAAGTVCSLVCLRPSFEFSWSTLTEFYPCGSFSVRTAHTFASVSRCVFEGIFKKKMAEDQYSYQLL